MLNLRDEQLSIWDEILPEAIRDLPQELKKIDELLDDKRFFKPFIEQHSTQMGRPTLAIDTYVRLMYLKHRYGFGYESLIQEVGDSVTWRRFCRIPLDEKMPHSTTLVKACKRYGENIIVQLNQVLVQKLTEQKVICHRKFRTDTTVVESDIHHPTDASLLQDGVKAVTRLVKKVRGFASHAAEGFKDKTHEIKENIFAIAKVLKRRTGETRKACDAITEKIVDISEEVCQQALSVIEKIKDKGKGSVNQLKNTLQQSVDLTHQLIAQAKQVVSGNRNIPDRIVSFFDPEARPIKKGKKSKPTEFGYKARIDETESGFVTGYDLYQGNPADESLLMPAVEQHKETFNAIPHAVATDRGFTSEQNETFLAEEGIKYVSTPRRGKKNKERTEHENQPWFKDLQRYRSAGEAKISLLKRKYGLNRSRYRGLDGSKSWIGFGILTHNLRKAAKMVA